MHKLRRFLYTLYAFIQDGRSFEGLTTQTPGHFPLAPGCARAQEAGFGHQASCLESSQVFVASSGRHHPWEPRTAAAAGRGPGGCCARARARVCPHVLVGYDTERGKIERN